MKLQEECRHETIRFGSGDYYIFCQDCPAAWVFKERAGADRPAPASSNKGVGGQLSGEARVTEGKPDSGGGK